MNVTDDSKPFFFLYRNDDSKTNLKSQALPSSHDIQDTANLLKYVVKLAIYIYIYNAFLMISRREVLDYLMRLKERE